MIDLIRTEEENNVVLKMIERLMEIDPKPDTYEGVLLTSLVKEVQKFEASTFDPSKDI